ncbi:unnamed protein product [Rotaria magnacalcarata]|uniref:FAS1 domain-containing protein n=1 Tax=Rotaria magnacalcarata TaxID=392030 RepID=A0A817AAF0_9BILA|nr:unnamed protein product [Rotaria magnacalcarata]CAF1315663.1 unnamed protein product [Rotaria magnacalcarata]CAF2080648.1 unnamed protein product [Rotaria magnacalcarata]CAF2200694.1 unnamed protein product [Rotaria magnacalcarata]CAF2256157.1 unnamed protein product [Rotaria magnacalcarata]
MHFIAVLILAALTLLHQASSSTDQLPSVIQLINKDERFTILALALQAIGVTEADDIEGPYTLFAPNDAAFNAVPRDVVEHLSDPKNVAELGELIAYHVIPEKAITAAQIQAMSLPTQLKTLTDASVTVSKDNNRIKVNDATVIASDIIAKNGIIHVIDKVLLPKAKSD